MYRDNVMTEYGYTKRMFSSVNYTKLSSEFCS